MSPATRPLHVRRPEAQCVHERVDAPRDDVAVVTTHHGDVEVPRQDLVRAEDGAVLFEDVSSDRKSEPSNGHEIHLIGESRFPSLHLNGRTSNVPLR